MTRILADRVSLPAERALLDAIRLVAIGGDRILLGSNGPTRGGRIGEKAYRYAVRHANGVAMEVLASWGADKSGVSDVDRVLGACVSCDRAALHVLTDKHGSLQPYLRDSDHQMLVWAIRTGRDCAVPSCWRLASIPTFPIRTAKLLCTLPFAPVPWKPLTC